MPLWLSRSLPGPCCGARTKAPHAQLSVGTTRNEQPNCVLLRLTVSTPEIAWPRPTCIVWPSYAASVRSRRWLRKAAFEFSDHTGSKNQCGAGWQPARRLVTAAGPPRRRQGPIANRPQVTNLPHKISSANRRPLSFSWDFAGRRPIQTGHKKRWPVLPVGEVAHGEILEPHVAFPAGVQLQGDPAIEGFGFGGGEIDHDDPVEDADHVIAFHLHEHVVPIGGTDHVLEFRGRPRDPAAIVAVQPADMVIRGAVDFELHARSD